VVVATCSTAETKPRRCGRRDAGRGPGSQWVCVSPPPSKEAKYRSAISCSLNAEVLLCSNLMELLDGLAWQVRAAAAASVHPSNLKDAIAPAKHAMPMANPTANACQDGRIGCFLISWTCISLWSCLISASASAIPYLARGIGLVPRGAGLGVRASMASPVSVRLRWSRRHPLGALPPSSLYEIPGDCPAGIGRARRRV
jgi:hypothetical protein